MRKKNAISLIVLVITIIIMAILAATVIITLSNTNIINKANDAVEKNNLKSAEEKASVAYANWKLEHSSDELTNIADLEPYGFSSSDVPDGYNVSVVSGVVKISKLNVWDSTVATSFAVGSGTEDDPYQISTGAELAYLASIANAGKSKNGVKYILVSDIDLANREWTPIGVSRFDSFFDGNGYTVYNLNVTGTREYAGLFGCVNLSGEWRK